MDVAQMGCRARKKSRKWHFPLFSSVLSQLKKNITPLET